jgi:hypothetical protein
MNTRTIFITCLIFALAGVTAYGQQQKGDLELQFLGSYYRTVGVEGYTFGSGNISGKIGPYITDNFQIGLGPSLTISHNSYKTFNSTTMKEEEVSETNTSFGTYAFVVYSFLTRGAKLVPYLGAQYFKQDFNKPWSEEPGSLGFNLGVKYFFAKKAAFDIQGSYMFDMNKDAEGGFMLFAFGLSFLI